MTLTQGKLETIQKKLKLTIKNAQKHDFLYENRVSDGNFEFCCFSKIIIADFVTENRKCQFHKNNKLQN